MSIHFRRLFAASLVTLLATGPATAGDVRPAVDRFAEPLARAGHLSGVLLVARGNTIVYERAWGLADQELRTPNTTATRFNIASVTKPLTQIAALRMIEQGALSLQDPVSRWIGEFPSGDSITIDMLLKHRSGIPHRVTEPWEESTPKTTAEMVALVMRKELLFPPGTSRSYSSAAYSVLARILELAAGKPYDRLLQELVFEPAGAVRSSHPATRELIEGRALSYLHDGERAIATPLADLSFLVGAGSVYSTARDVFLVQRAVVEGRYGNHVRENLMGERGMTWNGQTNGYRAFLDYDATSDRTVVFTGNVFTGAADLLRRTVPRLLAGETVAGPSVPTVAVTPATQAAQRAIEGKYRLGSLPVELRFETPARAMLGSWILIPIGGMRFFSPQDYEIVTVELSDSGLAEGLQWGKGPLFPRLEE